MGMSSASNYYKKIDTICVSKGSYSAETTKGEMKKRGVDAETCSRVENKVSEINLVDYYDTSGAVEYGMAVIVDCQLVSGHTVRTSVEGKKYLGWVETHTVENGKMNGDFLFLFQGVVAELVERKSKEHQGFLEQYEIQEKNKEKAKELEIKPGDIVNIHGDVIYLGEFYYYKPNLKTEELVSKPKKYKVYIAQEGDDKYRSDLIYVESSKTKQNQVTEVIGHVEIDIDKLKEEAFERLANIEQEGIGYQVTANAMFYSGKLRAYSHKNNQAYVLANMEKNKKDIQKPMVSDLLRLGWLCGWDIGKKPIVRYSEVRTLRKHRVCEWRTT